MLATELTRSSRAALVGCPFPCIQYGITDKALGHNCILGCCFAGAPPKRAARLGMEHV